MKNLAPIILFVYNRAWHTQQTVEALQKNDLATESELFIYADGAKQENDIKVEEVRSYIKTITGFRTINIVERGKNWGLAGNIIDGVSNIMSKFGKVIVLEDDLLTSKYFLQYMNDALSIYQNENKVWSIGACNFFSTYRHTPETFFSPIPDTLGWATWANRWQLFDKSSNNLLKQLKNKKLENKFNLYGAYDFLALLKKQAKGEVSSWAIRWQAQAYLHDALSLYPKYALTNHMESTNATHASNFSLEAYITFPSQKIKVEKQKIKFNKAIEKDLFNASKEIFKNPVKIKKNSQYNYKNIFKLFIPPIFFKIKERILRTKEVKVISKKQEKYGWFGDYNSWEEAKKDCTGYENDIILQKVKEAILKVKNGEAVYERDSVIFDKKEYSEELLKGLLDAASKNDYKLNVLDFGGSLGSTYFQNKDFLEHLQEFSWNIVEQENFVKEGKRTFEDKSLKFYYDIDDCLKENKINVLLLSGVLQYLDKPYEFINNITKHNFDYIILDRTAFTKHKRKILTIQKVPKEIYNASYPSYFFNEKKFTDFFEQKYVLKLDFMSAFTKPITLDEEKAYWKGFIFKRKN